MITPIGKKPNTVNKDSGKYNSLALFVEKSSLQIKAKNLNPLIIQSLKRQITNEEYDKMTETLNSLLEQLKEKEKYSKMKDNEIKRLDAICKEYDTFKVVFEELSKSHLELKKYTENVKIELEFFKDKCEFLLNENNTLKNERLKNQELINSSKKNCESLLELQAKFLNLEKLYDMKNSENAELMQAQKDCKVLNLQLQQDLYALKAQLSETEKTMSEMKGNIAHLETQLGKMSSIEKETSLAIKEKIEKINYLEKQIEIYIANETKYIHMFQEISNKTKLSYDNFHKLFFEQENKYIKKLNDFKAKIEAIKLKLIKKSNEIFIKENNLLSSKPMAIATQKKFTMAQNKISAQNKFEIIAINNNNISKKSDSLRLSSQNTTEANKQKAQNNTSSLIASASNTNLIIINKENQRPLKIPKESELEIDYNTIIEDYKKSINELKNDLKDKLIKIEKHDIEKTKLIYQIQNYERYMKENDRKYIDSVDKITQLELVINQLNSRIDIMTKENAKSHRNLLNKLKEETSKEDQFRKEYIQQIQDLKSQLQQYKIENQGKSKIIDERNEEIKTLKSQLK